MSSVGQIDPSVDLLVDLARDADAASLCNALEPRSHVDSVAIDAGVIVDHVADIDADSELHAALRLDCGIALSHLGLDGEGAFDRVHHAGEFGENAVAGGVDDAPGELADHREHDGLMPLEITHRAGLVRGHQCAIAGNVRRENGAQSPFHALFGHFDHCHCRTSLRSGVERVCDSDRVPGTLCCGRIG